MFYTVKVKDHIRVPPSMFDLPQAEAILKNIRGAYDNYVSKELGFVITVLSLGSAKEGVIIPGDGAGYFETEFELLTYKPEQNELVFGKVRDITDFGAFLEMGPTEGMVHISQSMDDFVSFSKEKVLQGKKSGQVLKVNDNCLARIIAVSFKDMNRPKIGLSMRQEGLGKLELLEQQKEKDAAPVNTEEEKGKEKGKEK
ncbi:MAG TPA: DNA-directed RNA polymerase [Candidatus Nanoarchaeia archaeon]|nr:DNA-directed RNA polymerase [Candidatus Nanoarchaeia archaeon]